MNKDRAHAIAWVIEDAVIDLITSAKFYRECPEELVKKVREVKSKIESCGAYKFRSTYVAHIFDGKGKNKMPIEINKGYDLLTKIVGKNNQEVSQYYEWLFSSYETDNDVVSTLVFLNDYLSDHTPRPMRY